MLLAVSLGLYPLASQTTAFAQPSLAEDIINSVEQETDSSSADGNVLDNNNEFGDDVPVIDQDNTADQDALNVGIQTQDQDQDLTQEAANIDVDVQEAEQVQQPPGLPGPEPTPQCPPGFAPENGQCRSTETAEPICPPGFAPENGQCRSTETAEPT
jgi:hypothetical protein